MQQSQIKAGFKQRQHALKHRNGKIRAENVYIRKVKYEVQQTKKKHQEMR